MRESESSTQIAHQALYYPKMPPKAAAAFKKDEVSSQETQRAKPRRRAVACKSCHALKVKCIPSDPKDLTSPCVRCIKTRRVCEIDTNYTRKKRKQQPDQDLVTELEQKIEKLNNELQQHRSQLNDSRHGSNRDAQSPIYSGLPSSQSFHQFNPISAIPQNTTGQMSSLSGTSLSGTPMSAERGLLNNSTASKRPYEYEIENSNGINDLNYKKTKSEQIDELIGSNALSDVSNLVTQVAENRSKRLYAPHVDLIEHGMLTLDEAKEILTLYREKIFAKYPFVDVPSNVEEFRTDYPILFNVVMAVTFIATSEGDVDRVLDIENIASQQVIHEVCLIGNKSIELLKSLMLFTIWYNMPELFHHRRYHIFGALSIAMTQDLGLTGRPYYVVNKSEGSVLRSAMLEDPQKDEYKCLVLSIYSTSIGYCLFLRRKLIATWTPYFEECYQSLRDSSVSKYKSVAIFAKLSSLLEKIHSFVDNKDQENLSFIQHFQNAIDYLKDQSTSIDSDILLGFAYSVEAFLYSQFTSLELSHKCLHSTLRCLHHFACLTPDQYSYMPLVVDGRLLYCFALLLKTSNYLKCDFDFTSIRKIMATLDECTKLYKANHLLVKTKLLFYFYLTTYSKNENVFNELAKIPPSETVVHHSQASSLQGTPDISTSSQPPITATRPTNVPPIAEPQQLIQNPIAKIPSPPSFKPLKAQLSNLQSITNISQPHQHTANHGHQQQIMQPETNHMYQQQHLNNQYPQHMNTYQGFNMSITASMLQPEGRMEPVYPQLDALSDATTKGFGDIPTELMGQDEFWKLFDYKDEQFLL